MNNIAVIDAELLIYRFAFKYKDQDRLKAACSDIAKMLKYVETKAFASSSIICLSDKHNFRHDIIHSYKDSRGVKPVLLHDIKQYVQDNYECKCVENLEADDLLGIYGTWNNAYVMCSIDKDLNQIPGRHYDWKQNKLYSVTLHEGDFYHMYQTLVGDNADNYFGCPGIGPVKANKYLNKFYAEGSKDSYALLMDDVWSKIVKLFEHGGLTEEFALKQARVSRILRATDYDFENNNVKLWRS